ncbi:MAG: DUF2752 domain-containing protein [Actinomycetia bacterium]|nr:DUF2752 domain-containing protein [Actinomycetes bacterium]
MIALRATRELDSRWLWLGGAIGLAVVLINLDEDGPVLCPSRALTGGYCPGCGMTRATGRVLRGDWSAAWRQHPLVFVVLAQLAVGALAVAHGGGWRDRLHRYLSPLLIGNVAVFVGVWALRLAQGEIPAPW